MDYLRIGTQLVFCAAVSSCLAGTLPSLADAADMATKAPPVATPSASDTNSSVIWFGGDFKNDVAAGNVGGIYAFSGNLDAPGWLVRGQFTDVGYDFSTSLGANGKGSGNFAEGSGAIGYQVIGNGLVASAFVGPDYQNYSIHPAAAASPNVGDRWGAIFLAVSRPPPARDFPSAVDGDYSTANNSFWVRGRTGVTFNTVTVGPEVMALGNNDFDEFRAGGYASYDLTSKLILQGDLGYADTLRLTNSSAARGGNGLYGGVALVFLH